ncbi:uncharacterized protein LOC124157854 isoform X2 [Ischnura elegans]|uniref:uncharacterized protein LOC124157854 isoform X2 n=1 Tax=Ischnura elegans TaxID=197161 RepID=UPI001ED8A3CB|nr:uncharacterized protein LOC124157854 isoform X2 [Ischnura elegans]XP_046388879.1 uncharacterized protein LOC124157854 isoform X2 [Ischnura elegans]
MEEPSSPSSADYQRILSVLRRDASLRCREQERIRRLRGAVDEEEEEEEDRKALALARERRLNGRACVRCRRGFPRSGAILRCARCRFRICGDCCMPGDAQDACFCIACYREVQLKSGDWFYSQLRKRFGGFGVQPEEGSFLHRNYNKALAEEVDSETAKVREFVERLVEALVSGGLDNVNINRLYSHPEYDCMFSNYHSSLCDAIARLTIALQMSISHHPLPANLDRIGNTEKDGLVAMVGEEDDDGLLCSPSVAHAQLKTLVQQVIDEARELPRLGIQQFSSNGYSRRLSDEGDIDMENCHSGNGAQSEHEDFASKTYEDILATAILNKVILQCQKENEWGPKKDAGGVDRNRNLLVDRVEVGVQAEVEALRTRGDGCGPEGASAEEYAEEDDEDYNDNTNFNSFGRWRNRSQPISYTIEKKVEEVMTTYSTEDEEDLVRLRHEENLLPLERDRTLSSGSSFDEDTSFAMIRGLAMHRKTAPFPEFGVDIIDMDEGDHVCSEDEDEQREGSTKINSTTKISGVDSWEENWLFQRRRLKMRGALSNGGYCSVPMLVPNPSEDLHAQIGDVDADEISDLSECNDSTEWDVNDEFTRSHHLSSSSASVISDSLSSEALSDPLLSSVPGAQECLVEAKNDGLLDFAEAHNHQQDSEYTEDYAVAEQRRLAMTPSPILNERENDTEACSEILTAQKPVPRPRTQITPLSRATTSPQKYIPPSNRQLPPSISKMEIRQAPESTVVHAGKPAHFILGLWSHLPANVWWFHEEFLLEEDDNHRIFSTALNSERPCTQYHLEIFNTDPENSSGKYSVAAVDACGNSIWQDFSLTVKGSRRSDFSPEFVVEPYDVTVGEGDEVEFLLEVKGHPEPKVSFWKGASLLHTTPDGYIIERQGGGHWTFRMNKITPMDGGKFVVEARNRVGVATATAEVQVVKLESASPVEESVPNDEEEMRTLSSLEASSSVLQNGLQHQAAELQTSAQKLSQLISQLEDLEIHIHSMEAEFGSLHSDLDFGGVDMTTYISSPWSTPLSSVSSSPPSSLSTSSSQAISALEDSSLEQRKAQLQQLLSCLQKEVDEAEGSRDELSESSPNKEVHPTGEQAAPPRPGTIAEREHRKWASAPPIPDNPYSPEKISERLRSINLKKSLEASRGSCSEASIEFPEFHSDVETREAAVPKVTINCGGKYLNPKKYGRDYYINSESGSGKHLVHRNKDKNEEIKQPDKMELIGNDLENEDLNMRKKGLLNDADISQLQGNTSSCEKESNERNETANHLENPLIKNERKLQDIDSSESETTYKEMQKSKCKSTTGMVVNTIPSVKDALYEGLPTGAIVSRVNSSNNTNQDQKVLVNRVKPSIESAKTTFKRSITVPGPSAELTQEPRSLPVHLSDGLPSLPSVRQLARQFSGASKSEETAKVSASKKKKKAPKEVIIVKKTGGLEAKLAPPLQVHSLTARSISREFREGLRQSAQVPLGKPVANPSENLNIRKKPLGDESQNSGNTDQANLEHTSFPQDYLSSDNRLQDSHCETATDENLQTFNPVVSQERAPSADSLIAEVNGPFLRNVEGSIAFWERLSPLGASSTNHQKDV